MDKKNILFAVLTFLPIMSFADIPARPNCEFDIESNFGTCFHNQSNIDLSVRTTIVTDTPNHHTTDIVNPFPNNYYISSTTNVNYLYKNGIKQISYSIEIDKMKLKTCKIIFVAPFHPMDIPKKITIVKSGQNSFTCLM